MPRQRGIGRIDDQIAELFASRTTVANRQNMKADNVKVVIKNVLAAYTSQLATGASNIVVYGVPLLSHELDVIRVYESARQQTLDADKTALQVKAEAEARNRETKLLINQVFRHLGGSSGHMIAQSVSAAADRALSKVLDARQGEEEAAGAQEEAEEQNEGQFQDEGQVEWQPEGLELVVMPPPRKRAANGSPTTPSAQPSQQSKRMKYQAPPASKPTPEARKYTPSDGFGVLSPAAQSSALDDNALADLTPKTIAEHMAKKDEADKRRVEALEHLASSIEAMATAVSKLRATAPQLDFRFLNVRPDVRQWTRTQVIVWLTDPDNGIPHEVAGKLMNLSGEDLELLDMSALKESFGLDTFTARKLMRALSKLTE